MQLSAVIIAKNERDRIERAIRSVSFCDEVVLLDSGSTDGTPERAEALGARVLRTDWPGYGAQKNRAWAEARGEWVLSIDADEEVSPALKEAIRPALRAGPAGFRVARRNVWLGHPLSHGRWYPDWQLRLARRERARWDGEELHERLVVDGPIGTLSGDLVHTPYRNLGEHLATIDRYTRLAALAARRDGRRASALDVLLRPAWHLFSALILHGGVRDGLPGVMVASLGALHTLVKWARIRGIDMTT